MKQNGQEADMSEKATVVSDKSRKPKHCARCGCKLNSYNRSDKCSPCWGRVRPW